MDHISSNRLILYFLILFFPTALFSQDDFPAQIRALEKSFGGRMGIMAKNLRTGEELAVAAKEKFPTASVIKLPVMVEYFYQIAEGRLNPTKKVALDSTNNWAGGGLYQYFTGRTEQQLADAVTLMIDLSDNVATNLVINALGETHAARLAAVNNRMKALGLENTRLLNTVSSWKTKTDSAESVRYGLGVSTSADMVLLLEKIYRGQVVDSLASAQMRTILGRQFFNDRIPRLLPPDAKVAHKTGSVTAVRNDVGLVLSEKADLAIAIFCDQIQDFRDDPDNPAVLAAARAARLVWNHFTGDSGFSLPALTYLDWNAYPGGEWARFYLHNAVYPHPSRQDGWQYHDKFFPRDPHYLDSSVVVIVPKGFHQNAKGDVNLIVHFHGWNNDNLGVLEKYPLAQQLSAARRNSLLVLAQGPWRASDSGGGKMEDEGGFRRMVEGIISTLTVDGHLKNPRIGQVIVTAHSGGYRPAIYAVARGGLMDHIREVFLFDAFYAQTEELIPWLKMDKRHHLRSIYTDHLAEEHAKFMRLLKTNHIKYQEEMKAKARVVLQKTTVCHDCVIDGTFRSWLEGSCLEPL